MQGVVPVDKIPIFIEIGSECICETEGDLPRKTLVMSVLSGSLNGSGSNIKTTKIIIALIIVVINYLETENNEKIRNIHPKITKMSF